MRISVQIVESIEAAYSHRSWRSARFMMANAPGQPARARHWLNVKKCTSRARVVPIVGRRTRPIYGLPHNA